MTASKPRRRPTNLTKLLLASMGAGAVAGIVAIVIGESGLVPPPAAFAGVVLVGGTAGLLYTRRWWTAVEEGVREAHKTSWFWGGSAGMVVAGAIAMALYAIQMGDAAQQFGLTPAQAGLLFTGMALMIAPMLVGYCLFWAGWWFTRSR